MVRDLVGGEPTSNHFLHFFERTWIKTFEYHSINTHALSWNPWFPHEEREAGGRSDALCARLPQGTWAGHARLDATDADAVHAVVRPQGTASAQLGGIDTLVVTTGHRHPLQILTKMDPWTMQEIIRTELLGPALLVRAVLPGMLEAGFGRIVLVGSDSGRPERWVTPCPPRPGPGSTGAGRPGPPDTGATPLLI